MEMESVTKLLKLQDTILENVERAHVNFKKSPKERITVGYVEGRLESLESYWTSFKSAHDQIIVAVSKDERKSLPYFTDDVYDSLEERYYLYKGELKDSLHKLCCAIKRYSQTVQGEQSNPTSSSMSSEVRLPHITIPTFTGNYTEWQSFHDLFLALVHKNQALEDVQKLHYLKANLKGDAEVLLRQFAITGDNYTEAWSVLKRRYDNKRFIANSIFKKFFGQKTLVQESATALRQLLDTSVECMNALKNLGLPTTQWDAIVNYIIVSKLDPGSYRHWEEVISDDNSEELPGFEKLKSFLETRFRTLEMVEPVNKNYKPANPKIFHVTTNTSQDIQCALCKDNHHIFSCKQFAKKSVEDRYNFVQENNLCFNCLIPNHRVFHCKQKSTCQVCKRRHHSLLHRVTKREEEEKEHKPATTTKKEETKLVAHVRSRKEEGGQHVLLATALVGIRSRTGESHVCRALLDQGSEASFVTAQLVEVLKLGKTPICGTISGVGEGNNVAINHKVDLQISSRYENNFSLTVNAYILKSLTRTLPSREIQGYFWPQLDNMMLADPTYDKPGRIDMLLGADVFGKIIDSGFMKGPGDVVAQYTHLGWILSGDTNTTSFSSTQNITSFHVTRELEEDNNLLRKFWEVEAEFYTDKKTWSKEEENCEESYNNTTIRDSNGRYIVHLPLKQGIEETVKLCGDTKQQAIVRFKQLERKFDRNEKLKKEYTKVIHEYLELGHMKKAENEREEGSIYLPHHAVVREDRDTTKVRVVFDASAKGSNGYSLNNAMMIGPTLQPGLRSLIIRWRAHKICVVADVIKMYRQVWVTEQHTDLQRIVWRDEPSKKLESFKLLTVTFGTAAAPYLAVKTLNRVADDEVHKYPRAAAVVKNSFYMDDLMTGHEDEDEVKTLCLEIREMLKSGGFELQKWSSNSEELLKTLQDGKTERAESKIEIKLDKVIKILGLSWDRKDDTFKITVNLPEFKNPATKRSIISEVASLFDPFGWLSPVVITAKVMIQRLWLCSLGWDDTLPAELIDEWMTYREDLHELKTVEVPRWIKMMSSCKDVQLHGFADASSVAYAAVAYLRVVDEDGMVHVTMLAAKTKVAPLKQLTIPRLELCGAVLAAKLLRELAELLDIPMHRIYAWTDSMVVLSWLQSQPSRWQVFVGNRVSEIIQQIDNDRWRHVQSADNPADLASRGMKACDIANSELWWTGPDWLKEKDIEFSRTSILKTELEEKKVFHCTVEQTSMWERFSSMSRLKRVIAQCRRFIDFKNKINREDILNTEELDKAEECCIKYYQGVVYGKELEDLSNNGMVSSRSSLISLNPYLDENGLLRVGGRLSKANLSESEKHPIVIPGKQHITKLIIKEAHIRTLHGDIQEMMCYVRTKYWIVGLKSAVRQCTHKCTVCIREKAKIKQQLMGQLPAQRVTPQRPFFNSGVDYAGPIQLRTSKGRGYKCTKGYICLFVCMSTRAIHLEAVTDLTSQAFIAAFRRFVARRGHCSGLWSDNGTNFVGANKELKQMFVQSKDKMNKEVAKLLANDGTTWHFIPSRAANFGGIWEAGVRSAKKHLSRINGTTKLTYEEIATLLAQIEACLNSRPLCRLDQTLDTLDPLTPGHFLIGEPVINVPDNNYVDRNINLLNRWQLVQNKTQDFWKRWKSEYLNTLQQKYKWHKTVQSPVIGDIVIIKEDGLPPAKWLLGKVVNLHPGSDQLVRVVTVQCKGNHVMKRPLNKLVLLPTQPDE